MYIVNQNSKQEVIWHKSNQMIIIGEEYTLQIKRLFTYEARWHEKTNNNNDYAHKMIIEIDQSEKCADYFKVREILLLISKH